MKTTTALIFAIALMGCNTAKDYVKGIKVDLPTIGGTTTTTSNQTTTTTQSNGNTTQAGCSCDLGKPLTIPYDQAYMDEHGESEECGLEADLKIICRACVIRPDPATGYWKLSKPFRSHLKKDSHGNGVLNCFTENGYNWHIKGYSKKEPLQETVRTMSLEANGEFIVIECRGVK